MELNFQEILPGQSRPCEECVNYKPIFINNSNSIPSIGDFIEFMSENDGQIGIYEVKSRFFQYSLGDNQSSVRCNIVVERNDDAAPRLLKE